MDDDSKKKELENEKNDDWKNPSLYAEAASGQKAVSHGMMGLKKNVRET